MHSIRAGMRHANCVGVSLESGHKQLSNELQIQSPKNTRRRLRPHLKCNDTSQLSTHPRCQEIRDCSDVRKPYLEHVFGPTVGVLIRPEDIEA